VLISETRLHHSNDTGFRARLPWRLGLVRLEAGPTMFVHVLCEVPPAPANVIIDAHLNEAGAAVLVACHDKGVIA
jgi:hypothetical protein